MGQKGEGGRMGQKCPIPTPTFDDPNPYYIISYQASNSIPSHTIPSSPTPHHPLPSTTDLLYFLLFFSSLLFSSVLISSVLLFCALFLHWHCSTCSTIVAIGTRRTMPSSPNWQGLFPINTAMKSCSSLHSSRTRRAI